MKMKIKKALSIFLISIPSIATFAYLYFWGNPILKHSIGLEEKAYAAGKYDMNVKIVETHYNFKDSSYEATLKPADSDSPSFLVYQRTETGGKKKFRDTYREEVWGKELQKKTQPMIKELFPEVTKIAFDIPLGSHYSLPNGQIPSYLKMETVPYQMNLTIGTEYQENENSLLFQLIDYMRKEHLSFGTIRVNYQNDSFFVDEAEWSSIKTENDINKYVNMK